MPSSFTIEICHSSGIRRALVLDVGAEVLVARVAREEERAAGLPLLQRVGARADRPSPELLARLLDRALRHDPEVREVERGEERRERALVGQADVPAVPDDLDLLDGPEVGVALGDLEVAVERVAHGLGVERRPVGERDALPDHERDFPAILVDRPRLGQPRPRPAASGRCRRAGRRGARGRTARRAGSPAPGPGCRVPRSGSRGPGRPGSGAPARPRAPARTAADPATRPSRTRPTARRRLGHGREALRLTIDSTSGSPFRS